MCPMSAYVVGADGCKSGWITAVYKPENGRLTFTTHSDFASLLKSFSSDTTIAVDIPIGLTETFQPRICDRRARIVVGPRRSSVFPAPDRRLLQSSTYEEACALSRKISRKGITRQSFGIFNKIAQVDALMSPNLQSRVFEIHPEVCFWAAADRQQLYHPKRTQLSDSMSGSQF
jgi:predicted RNase H-like nuclease